MTRHGACAWGKRDGPECSSLFTWQQVAMCTAALYDDLLSHRFALSSARQARALTRGDAR